MGNGKGTFEEPRPCVSGQLLSPILIIYPLKTIMLFQKSLNRLVSVFSYEHGHIVDILEAGNIQILRI